MKFHDPRRLTETIFELNSCIKETNFLIKFHENWAKNVTSRKNAPPTVFSPIRTIFELVQDINKTNGKLPLYKYREKNPPTGGHVFSTIWTIFELVRDIN
ncbi:hypothetical protein DPMN_095520 [Dreissena polymorpha]|uniref:Uncharacterized protein n=1 Tax=Dreissena polymorpha TaxID=45954 RepID=A0A9D4L6M7_DREPO|nr:hypothetical protein DPMN_095520 [Dreissena polymorpha]